MWFKMNKENQVFSTKGLEKDIVPRWVKFIERKLGLKEAIKEG